LSAPAIRFAIAALLRAVWIHRGVYGVSAKADTPTARGRCRPGLTAAAPGFARNLDILYAGAKAATQKMATMNDDPPRSEVTLLLQRWRAGDQDALAALFPLVYEELRALAQRHLRRERGSHTLQRTALVHEAFLRMIDQKHVDWESRQHFFGLASQMMRRILVDHARRRTAAKRGGHAPRVDMDSLLRDSDQVASDSADAAPAQEPEIDFEAVHLALERLEALDVQQGKLVELRFFGGLTIKEAADVLGVSAATAKREWAVARAWLERELTTGAGP
jgi:RNA polymerase sigma factor (TIGR02999 family)